MFPVTLQPPCYSSGKGDAVVPREPSWSWFRGTPGETAQGARVLNRPRRAARGARADLMPRSTGPRLIMHAADDEELALDPRLELTAAALHTLEAHKSRILTLRREVQSGNLSAMSQFTEALTEGFSLTAQAMVQLPTARARTDAFVNELPGELRKIRREYVETARNDPDAGKLEIVEVAGDVNRGLRLGYFRAELVDKSWGHLQRRSDDCFTAAVATCLEAQPYEVPDLHIEELLAAGRDPEEIDRVIARTLGAWLETNAVTLRVHPAGLPVSAKRWIGIVEPTHEGANSHCILFEHREPIFDTAWLLPPRKDEPLTWHSLDDVGTGIEVLNR